MKRIQIMIIGVFLVSMMGFANITSWFQGYVKEAYLNGVKEGIERRFRNGSEVVETISWVSGQRHGISETYIGNQTKRSWYFRGQLVSKSAYDSMLRPQN
jgi:hypothetical protein